RAPARHGRTDGPRHRQDHRLAGPGRRLRRLRRGLRRLLRQHRAAGPLDRARRPDGARRAGRDRSRGQPYREAGMSPADPALAAAHDAVDWIKRLVSIDTTSRNSNLGLIEMVRDELRQAGIESHLSYDAGGAKANLYATVPAADGSTQGGIVLSGHTDVVPVDGQDWDSDPFQPQVREGRLYGRGTSDMKGYIGTALSLLPRMTGATLKKPIHFALSYDEEVGCVGAPLMLADLQARGVRPEGCIVGEPTSMRVIVAHKGINVWRCCVRGHAAHSSLHPKGLNAIEYAAQLICFIREQADRMRAAGPF